MTTFRTNFAAALPVIASVSILAVTVGVETANAQSYRRYGLTNCLIRAKSVSLDFSSSLQISARKESPSRSWECSVRKRWQK